MFVGSVKVQYKSSYVSLDATPPLLFAEQRALVFHDSVAKYRTVHSTLFAFTMFFQ